MREIDKRPEEQRHDEEHGPEVGLELGYACGCVAVFFARGLLDDEAAYEDSEEEAGREVEGYAHGFEEVGCHCWGGGGLSVLEMRYKLVGL